MRRKRHILLTGVFCLVVTWAFSPHEVAADGPPAYIAEPWVRLGGPPGGIGYDIRMQPNSPDTMFVTDAGAGVFKSTNGGVSWLPTNRGIASTPDAGILVFCVTIDPHDSNTVWVGTQFTAQIYRSTDGGESWHRRDDGIIPISGEHSVRGITVDPNDQNVVYAGLEEGIPTTDGISRSMGEVYKSINAGATWERIWHGDNLARYIWVDPRNSELLYVSTGIFDRNAANSDSIGEGGGVGILRSEDGGMSWTVLDTTNGLGGLFCPSLFMHPKNPNILLAAISGIEGLALQPGAYVSQNGGNTWSLSYPMGSAEAVEIAPSDSSVWYVAAKDVICRSDNAGQTWLEYPMRTVNRGSGTPIDLQVDPRNPFRLFVNTYNGGNMVSIDGGETWVDASNGYTGASIRGVGVSPDDDRKVLAGANLTTWISDDGGSTWRGNGVVGAALRIVSYTTGDSTITLAAGGFDDGGVYRSSNFGAAWDSIEVVDLDAFEDSAGVPPETRYGAQALAVAPSNPQRVYLGYSERAALLQAWGEYQQTSPGLFRSLNGGVNWTQVDSLPFADASIMNIAVDPADENTLYATTMAGVYRSTTGGNSWDSLKTTVPLYPLLPPVYITVVDPFNSDVLYAGSPRGGVYVSADAGSTWTAAGIGMDPNEAIIDLLPDPSRPGVIYASTRESGVYVSSDSSQTWQNLSNGYPAGIAGGQLVLNTDGSVLYAGTGAAGVFRLGTPGGSVSVPSPSPILDVRFLAPWPNPARVSTNLTFALEKATEITVEVFDVQGRLVSRPIHRKQFPEGVASRVWNPAGLSSGIYYLRAVLGDKVTTRKLVWLP